MWIFGGGRLRRALTPARGTTPVAVNRLAPPLRGDARRRTDEVLLVCARCQPGAAESWVRRLRRRAYERFGSDAVTVSLTGCLRNCPDQGVALTFASARGCWEWPVDVTDTEHLDDVLACLSAPERT